jgi:serine/threonine protein kinase
MLAGYLPFDDDPANPDGDNINLLYKYIVSTPLTFPEYVTPHARDLLRRILVPDPRKRADLFEVARHSWLSEFSHVVSHITSSTTKVADIADTTVPPGEFANTRSRSLTLTCLLVLQKVIGKPQRWLAVPPSESLRKHTRARYLRLEGLCINQETFPKSHPSIGQRLLGTQNGERCRLNMSPPSLRQQEEKVLPRQNPRTRRHPESKPYFQPQGPAVEMRRRTHKQALYPWVFKWSSAQHGLENPRHPLARCRLRQGICLGRPLTAPPSRERTQQCLPRKPRGLRRAPQWHRSILVACPLGVRTDSLWLLLLRQPMHRVVLPSRRASNM